VGLNPWHATLFGISNSLDRSGTRCGHRGGDAVPVLDQRGVQASAFAVHARQQDPSKLVQRGLSGGPNWPSMSFCTSGRRQLAADYHQDRGRTA
jgi:hypothetical protein